jgi:nitric-oxide synthase, brain
VNYEKWKLDYSMNMAEILEKYTSIKLTYEFLIFNLPKLQPRYYSISSSPRKYPNELHITLLVVEYRPANSRKLHYGVCSKMFDELDIGRNVLGFIKKYISYQLISYLKFKYLFHLRATNFRLAENRKAPILMIGAGSGIAPFRSFWQENETSKPRRLMIQYFGCRNPRDDELYKREIREYKSKSIINEYHVAYSRYNKSKKTYVQDLLDKNSNSIVNYIVNKNAHIYVCGHVKMANDVSNKLAKILYRNGTYKSLQKAKEFINELKYKNIYHEDIFKSH